MLRNSRVMRLCRCGGQRAGAGVSEVGTAHISELLASSACNGFSCIISEE